MIGNKRGNGMRKIGVSVLVMFLIGGVERTKQYLSSVRRVLEMEGIEVNVANHESMGQVFSRYRRLKGRRAGQPHPFVDPEAFQAFLQDSLEKGEKKLQVELAREKN